MHRLNSLLLICFLFGGFGLLNDSVYGQQPITNGTNQLQYGQSSSSQLHELMQQQRPKGPQKHSWGQTNNKYSTGVVKHNDSTRRNLTNQKQSWDRQGDDPNRSPIHIIHQKIVQSDVSLKFFFFFDFFLSSRHY